MGHNELIERLEAFQDACEMADCEKCTFKKVCDEMDTSLNGVTHTACRNINAHLELIQTIRKIENFIRHYDCLF